MPDDPVDLIQQNVGVVLQWKDVYGSQSTWEIVRRDVSRLDALPLAGCAAHWNALVRNTDGSLDDERQKAVVQFLASPDQLQAIDEAVRRRVKREGGGQGLPPIINRQQLLILMRLAFQLGRWDGDGRPVKGSELLDILLRINDHLEALPNTPWYKPSRKRGSIFRRVIAFPLMFALLDFSHIRRAENGVTRTLRILREIHPDLAAQPTLQARALDVAALFQQGAGLSLETHLSLTFAAFALTMHPDDPGSFRKLQVVTPRDNGDFNIGMSQLIGESALTAAEVETFLSRVARTPEEFKTLLADPTQVPEQGNFTVFRKYPIIRFTPEVVRVIDRQMLLDKLGDGAYWLVREVVESQTEPGLERIKVVKRLNGWWGLLFEEYTHRLVEASPVATAYTRQPTFEGEAGDGAIDGLLHHGTRLVLLEYKVSPVTPAARTTPKPRLLAKEILAKFAGPKGTHGRGRIGPRGTPQLAAAVREFVSGRSLGGVTPNDIEAIFPVIVCGEHGMGAPMVNCLLNRRFRRDLGDADTPRVRPLTVLTIEDFERVLADGRDVASLMQGWLDADPRMATYPGLVLREKVLQGDGMHDWVRQAAEAWKIEMVTRLFPHGKTARGQRGDPLST